ncbi:MAG TPA: primosomal protein N' [Dongiaceae bacterium]|jgi:primosomal protein N' (replication factor Y)|nr:primosomal protein N' [Dongiaceae bacterium]
MKRVSILLPLPVGATFDYMQPEGMELRPGDFVSVPFRQRRLIGVVWEGASGTIDAHRLRPVLGKCDLPPLPPISRRFVDWVAAYVMVAPGAILRMALSAPEALLPEKERHGWIAAPSGEDQSDLSSARRRVLACARDGEVRSTAQLASGARVGVALIRAMAKAGLLVAAPFNTAPVLARPNPERPSLALSPQQAEVAGELLVSCAEGQVTLLDGVTGSGKTEVYFEAIAATLRAGKQVLVLMPEIALTAQFLTRFERRFGVLPAQWHSDLGAARRRETWLAVLKGQAAVVVGARSALFLPFPNLGLIIVDEEHDATFKQEDQVHYHARDMAIVRAHLAHIPAVLASATPSLETLQNVERGRYRRLALPNRHGGAQLPDIRVVDLKRERLASGRFLSAPLVAAMGRRLEEGEQCLLFLNRRGYAPLTLCRGCGERLECPHCAAWLVQHRARHRLQCHHCGFQSALPVLCPHCGAHGEFVSCGPGVERIAEEAATLFPAARRLVLSSDVLSSPRRITELIGQIERREVDLIIGTQIVAKGHHFPHLTLVGIVDADLGLAGGDLRGGEKCFQLLTQVAGRAGRGDKPGEVYLQTYRPDSSVVQALRAADRDRFLAAEAEERESAGMPPFGRLAAVILSGKDADAVEHLARGLARTAPKEEGIRVFGPAPAPLALLRGRHRMRLLVKARRSVNLQRLLRPWLATARLGGDLALQIDIDPYSFL